MERPQWAEKDGQYAGALAFLRLAHLGQEEEREEEQSKGLATDRLGRGVGCGLQATFEL